MSEESEKKDIQTKKLLSLIQNFKLLKTNTAEINKTKSL